MKKPIITIDGPAGAGKTTLAGWLAESLGLTLLESGSLYRAVGLAALEAGISADDEPAAARLMAGLSIDLKPGPAGNIVLINGRDVTAQLRDETVGNMASAISQLGPVREKITEIQRFIGRDGGIVLEGRDAGTVVFPDAEFKFFLDAGLDERTRRRVAQLADQGAAVDPGLVRRQIAARDRADSTRKLAPLKPASGAIIIDTTSLNRVQVLEAMKTAVTGG